MEKPKRVVVGGTMRVHFDMPVTQAKALLGVSGFFPVERENGKTVLVV